VKGNVREILRTLIVALGVALLLTYVHGWERFALLGVLLALYLWPKVDPVARRERRIERQATLMATLIEDMQEIIPRAMEKMHYPSRDDLPTGIEPGDIAGHVQKSE
jgi:uncharacterized protein (DUF58 family)